MIVLLEFRSLALEQEHGMILGRHQDGLHRLASRELAQPFHDSVRALELRSVPKTDESRTTGRRPAGTAMHEGDRHSAPREIAGYTETHLIGSENDGSWSGRAKFEHKVYSPTSSVESTADLAPMKLFHAERQAPPG